MRRVALLLISAQLALSVPPTQLYSGDRSSITGPTADHDHDDGVGRLHSGAAPTRACEPRLDSDLNQISVSSTQRRFSRLIPQNVTRFRKTLPGDQATITFSSAFRSF
jgi:hypothetical protein